MAHITVTIAGRSYRMACADGEQVHLAALAEGFDARVTEMRQAFGEIGDMRLHVMAALTISDEIADLKRRLDEQGAELAQLRAASASSETSEAHERARIAEGIDDAAGRIERMARMLVATRA